MGTGMRRGLLCCGLILAGLGTQACVPYTKYEKLETKYTAAEGQMASYRSTLEDVEGREQLLARHLEERKQEVAILQAELKKKDIQLHTAQRAMGQLEGELEEARSRPEPMEQPTYGPDNRVAHDAAPEGTEVNERTGGIIFDNAILFPSGLATLKDSGKKALASLAARIQQPEFEDFLVRVDGHTDDAPIVRSANKDNWELSSKRALAVLNFLEAEGIPSERLRFAGYSYFEPLVAEVSTDARKKNRRVEIVLFRP